MTLTDPRDAQEAWSLFKDTPLFAKWPEAQSELAQWLTVSDYGRNEVIYEPDDPAGAFYLIASGSVRQTIEHNRRTWFERRLDAGNYFGEFSLFTGQRHTRVVALVPTRLYQMPVANVREAMERNPELREVLLCEKLAQRLRGVPLFQDLSSEDIGWLALLMEEKVVEKDTPVVPAPKPGLWVIDWGQVQVTGPAALGRSPWRLTAGNFFLSPGPYPSYKTIATTATATLKTRLLFLSSEHFRRLVSAVPEIGRIAAEPLDIAAYLSTTPNLIGKGMTPAHFLDLAQICAWDFVPAGQNITSQGTVGYSLVRILNGAAVVRAVDNDGRLRPTNLLRAGQAFGATSLLQSRHRDATVRAVADRGADGRQTSGTEILTLDRRDLRYAFASNPTLWQAGVWLFDRSTETKKSSARFNWQQEGETIVWQNRGHWLWLFVPEFLTVLLFVLLILGAIWLKLLSPVEIEIDSLIVFLFLVFPFAIWSGVNYFDDYYVITNRRVTRRDRRLLMWESRADAPLEMVQDVTVDSDFFGRLFNYGDVTIRTAAKVGSIRFDNVPDPDTVRNQIMTERAGAAAAMHGQHQEILRRGLVDSLRLAQLVSVPDEARALGPDVTPPPPGNLAARARRLFRPAVSPRPVVLPGAPRPQPGWFINLMHRLPPRLRFLLLGRERPQPAALSNDTIIWRKHWVNLLDRGGTAILALLVATLLLVGAFLLPPAILGLDRTSLLLVALVLFVPSLLWFLWHYIDYRNDIYVVTNDKIIDIERKPLGLASQRRESALDRIQNVTSEQKGLLANILDYGDVIIQTAAADAGFTFNTVPHPRGVQRAIFQRVDAYRRQQDERALAQRQRELIEGLQVYHELRGDRPDRLI